MRPIRDLTLLVTVAIATTLPASAAFAQVEPLTHNQTPRLIVQQEVHAANDVPCPAVTPSPTPTPGPLLTGGGCRVHKVGPNTTFSVHTVGGMEAIAAICDVEYDARIDAAGEGYISHQELVGLPDTCARRACGQVTPPTSEGRAWSMYMYETEPAPRERGVLLFCIEPLDGSGPPHHCEITVPMSSPTPHRSRGTASEVTSHGTAFPHCEISGTFESEAVLGTSGEAQAEQNVEMRHS
jgi:hypothetical protein